MVVTWGFLKWLFAAHPQGVMGQQQVGERQPFPSSASMHTTQPPPTLTEQPSGSPRSLDLSTVRPHLE